LILVNPLENGKHENRGSNTGIFEATPVLVLSQNQLIFSLDTRIYTISEQFPLFPLRYEGGISLNVQGIVSLETFRIEDFS